MAIFFAIFCVNLLCGDMCAEAVWSCVLRPCGRVWRKSHLVCGENRISFLREKVVSECGYRMMNQDKDMPAHSG